MAANQALQRKVQRLLALRPDSANVREALACLDPIAPSNTPAARRNLRSTLEAESNRVYSSLVEAFEPVEASLAQIEELVEGLHNACETADQDLRRTRSTATVILQQAAALRAKQTGLGEQQAVLEMFTAKFLLSEEDAKRLRSTDEPVDEAFFAALGKLEEVRSNARYMLGAAEKQTSGIDILHETSGLQEVAYERLFVWVQQKCAAMVEAGDPLLPKALELLRERPVYFQHCARELASARRAAVVQAFWSAMSSGGEGGSAPIDLQAYDCVRFVGDMLAWVHQRAASEKEMLAGVVVDGAATETVLDFVFEGLREPVETRFNQVLSTAPKLLSLYQAAQLVAFYASTLAPLLGTSPTGFVALCKDLHEQAEKKFLADWSALGTRLAQPGLPGRHQDLAPPPGIAEAVRILDDVLTVYDATLVAPEDREAGFAPVLATVIDPLLQAAANAARHFDAPERPILLINCLAAVQAPLRRYAFTAARADQVQELLDAELQRFVAARVDALCTKFGFAERLAACRADPAGGPASLSPVGLASSLKDFYSALALGPLAQHQVERIVSRVLRTEARSAIATGVHAAYEELYDFLERGGVQAGATHTPEQVRTLLEI